MPKSSKQTSGNFLSTGVSTHASPVANGILRPRIIPSLKIPSLSDSFRQVDEVPVRNSEVITPSNASNKIFSIHTGLAESEPAIVLSSEFLPLYDNGKKTSQGEAISLKEGSKILNAKTAIAVLSQSMDSRAAFDLGKQDLRSYVEAETNFISGLTSNLNVSLNSLNVSSYVTSYEGLGDPFSNGILSLNTILTDAGYKSENINKFTLTKTWQQALVETKRTLLTHSTEMLSQNFTRQRVHNDIEPYDISDISETPKNLKRLWLNPYVSNSVTEASMRDPLTFISSISNLSSFENIQFVNLKYANPLEKKIRSVSGDIKLGLSNTGDTENLFFSHDELRKLEETGKDIAFLSNLIFKESLVSSYLIKGENASLLSSRFGYTINRSGDNFSVWDHLVGRVPKNILEFYKNPTGNGNSLISFSQDIVADGDDNYRILKFENEFLEGTSTTPGSYYYVESSLNTIDGKNFDISRLDDLIKRTSSALETVKSIIEISGYSVSPKFTYSNNYIGGIDENYTRRSVSSDFDLSSLTEKFSLISRTYSRCLKITDSSIERLDTASMRPGLSFTQEEISGIRLASLLCKTAIYPELSFQKDAKKIKSHLFMWLMNSALGQIYGNTDTSYLEDLKKKISNLFIKANVGIGNSELQIASDDFRTVPIVVGSAPYIGDVPDLQSQIDSGVLEQQDQQEVIDSILSERRQAYNIYSLSAVGRLFSIDESKGVWRLIVDSLRSVYTNSDLYFEEVTAYSGMSKMYYMYAYFDLLLRIISSQTPETLLGVYSGNYEYKSSISYAVSEDNPDKNYYENSITISETGFLIGKTTKDQLNEQFFISAQDASKLVVKKLSDSISLLHREEIVGISSVAFFKKYLLDLGSNLSRFRSFLVTNFQTHLDRMNALYQSDTTLDTNQKSALLSLSFTRDQLKLTNYIMSEFTDRLSESNDISSKLKSHPAFSTFVDNFMDFMPVNETEIVSHALLSSYFMSNEFNRNKGNNKKIISVGLPPKLARSLVLTPATVNAKTSARNSIIRLKVYKNDRLHPDVVYQPRTFLFETSRFPTRVISNWDYDSLVNDSSNILSFPTKLATNDNRFLVHKDFTEAFPDEIYGGILSEDEKLEIYENHVISFLTEEYLRWFTDCRFDETRYNNYTQLTSALDTVERQFSSYIEFVKRNSATITSQQQAPAAASPVKAVYTDPASGQSYQIPLKTPTASKENQETTAQKSLKDFTLPMNDTVRSFFKNETFLTDSNVFKRRMSYPKKFDRVFNVIIDPDDFYVDMSMTSTATLDSLVQLGVLTGGDVDSSGKKNPYKHRDTSPTDITLCEYFVTVEPYDYVQENA